MFLHVPSCSFIFLHFPSCSFMFVHVLSCSFMFVHVRSCSFMFVHVRSCSFIFVHILSYSFIFFHFLSFSFIFSVFVGCSNFFGPQFRYDFSGQFLCEKSIFGLGPSFLFFLLFFSRVSFFSCYLFFHFFTFCSFLHFLFFNVFHFFIFFEEKVSSFLFSCNSFKYFLLLALVSEFNCFLRSRCSMEMWCPDDIGRDSWDWVGPTAWRRACFNSPEWGGSSSPVKTEPPQIVLLLLLNGYNILKE